MGLKHGGHPDIEIPPQQVFKSYFGEYSASAKANRTQGGPKELFRDLAKFLLEIASVHTTNYGIITAYTRGQIDWGSITTRTVEEHTDRIMVQKAIPTKRRPCRKSSKSIRT